MNGGADEWLTPPERLAIAYAPRRLRPRWAGLMAFDRRLADAARAGREPIMIQLRLAWWRDRLAEPAAHWPRGEPLLALLAAWDDHRARLTALVDGWEAQVVGDDGGVALASARVAAIGAIAETPLTPRQSAALAQWAQGAALGTVVLPRSLRPLILLDHFATNDDAPPWRMMLGALRKGWFGR